MPAVKLVTNAWVSMVVWKYQLSWELEHYSNILTNPQSSDDQR